MATKEHSESYKQRREAGGYIKFCPWIPKRDKQKAIDFIAKLNHQYEQDKLEGKA
jgi:hypothetical protein